MPTPSRSPCVGEIVVFADVDEMQIAIEVQSAEPSGMHGSDARLYACVIVVRNDQHPATDFAHARRYVPGGVREPASASRTEHRAPWKREGSCERVRESFDDHRNVYALAIELGGTPV
jgi:hypothetical protein